MDKHVEIQVNKANKILGMIRRAYTYIDKDTMRLLYKSLIRPHLEYGHVVAYPRYDKSATRRYAEKSNQYGTCAQ